jgi:Ca-activated chloride channel family protein
MAGPSIRQAKAALQLAVDSLNEQDSFNIIEFNSEARELWSFPGRAFEENKAEALRFLRGLKAEGGTNIFTALHLALDTQKNTDKLKQLVFITDGAIGYETELLQELEAQLYDMRLFTVGIGSAPNSYFMVEAAKVGRGTFTHIGDLSQVSQRMSELLDKLAKPNIANIELDFGMPVEIYPRRVPDLYEGEPVIVSYLAPYEVSKIEVTGQKANQNWRKSLDLQNPSDGTGISKYWAQFKIRELMAQKRLVHSASDSDAIKERITQTALDHELVSPYTSLIAIEKEIVRVDIASAAKRPGSPLMASMPNTAAGSNQAFTLALIALMLAALVSLWTAFCEKGGGARRFLGEKHV